MPHYSMDKSSETDARRITEVPSGRSPRFVPSSMPGSGEGQAPIYSMESGGYSQTLRELSALSRRVTSFSCHLTYERMFQVRSDLTYEDMYQPEQRYIMAADTSLEEERQDREQSRKNAQEHLTTGTPGHQAESKEAGPPLERTLRHKGRIDQHQNSKEDARRKEEDVRRR